MKKLLLLGLIISFNIIAQETEDKYIMLKPLSWDELQLYQLDNLRTAGQLELAENCPKSLRGLQETHNKTGTHFQHIEGTNYSWTEYTNIYGLKCIVKHEKVESLITDEGKSINPNTYEILDDTQARILLSASIGGGNTQKERARTKRIMEINRINQAIQEKPYEKYGGSKNLMLYMKNNKPKRLDNKKALVQNVYRNEDGNITGAELFSRLEIFENEYSKGQQDELIESVKKKLKQKYK